MYNGKNYVGEDIVHIGGKIEFEDGAFPAAVNVADDTGAASKNAATLSALLKALKDAGLMVGDAWDLEFKTSKGASLHDMPTAETLSNSNKVTGITITDNVISVALSEKVEDLEDADHGAGWGEHKWLGFGVKTGLASIVGVTFEQTEGGKPFKATLTSADATEASDIGLSAGDFVLYIKAENVVKNPIKFKLGYTGFDHTEFTVKIVEPTS